MRTRGATRDAFKEKPPMIAEHGVPLDIGSLRYADI